MASVEHSTPELLRAAAVRIERDRTEHPDLRTVRDHIHAYLLGWADLGTLTADDLTGEALRDVQRYQREYGVPSTRAGLVTQLGKVAGWREQLDAFRGVAATQGGAS